ncbi:hypothetical protein PFICI_04385 [Pestalotiopsis fici W106-1]|uniref:Uncharacterized protein n=1 Tax=Pestalotiopsis fici (strain W106-1 / CGMCC3.15140) TaxID=1229662 RepID=W3X904_PESFW|nr:uncharacterized protein PFICI_04385 [Pestalotiopsis fici W106-1]ETS82509.1 hypothetical protein PFICI_04385 [Pestalotiopsis fici W106-1]
MSRIESRTETAAPPGSSKLGRWFSEWSLQRRVKDFSANPRAVPDRQRIELLRSVVALADDQESAWLAARFGGEYSAWLRRLVEFQAAYSRDYMRDGRLGRLHRDGLWALEDELGGLESYWRYFTALDDNRLVQAAACEHIDLVNSDARKRIEACRAEIEQFNGVITDQRTAWLLKTEMLR